MSFKTLIYSVNIQILTKGIKILVIQRIFNILNMLQNKDIRVGFNFIYVWHKLEQNHDQCLKNQGNIEIH